jgi:hypothetical protein
MAMLFVTLFGVMSISHFYISNLNVQMARNHRDIAHAYAMSESGLEYAQWLITRYLEDEAPYTYSATMTPEEKRAVFTDFTEYTTECLFGSTILGGNPIDDIQSFSEGELSGWQFTLPAIQTQVSEPGQFTLQFRQYESQLEIVEITCTGTRGTLNRTVQLDFAMSIEPPNLFDFAIFGRDSLSLSEGVTVDGYNFEAGDNPLAIGSLSIDASSIALHANVTVDGNVEVAPGGEPDSVVYCGNGASITGDVYVRDEDWLMPIVEVPTALESSSSEGSINSSNTITTSGKYDSINLGKNDVLTIDGDVKLYVTGDILLGQAARIEVNSANPDARLTLYMGGDLVGQKSAALTNPSVDATRMIILGLEGCQLFELNNSGLVHAAIYTPNAEVQFHHLVELYGSVVGRTFLQNNGTNVHYDANLRDLNVEGVSCDINVACQPNSYVEM